MSNKASNTDDFFDLSQNNSNFMEWVKNKCDPEEVDDILQFFFGSTNPTISVRTGVIFKSKITSNIEKSTQKDVLVRLYNYSKESMLKSNRKMDDNFFTIDLSSLTFIDTGKFDKGILLSIYFLGQEKPKLKNYKIQSSIFPNCSPCHWMLLAYVMTKKKCEQILLDQCNKELNPLEVYDKSIKQSNFSGDKKLYGLTLFHHLSDHRIVFSSISFGFE